MKSTEIAHRTLQTGDLVRDADDGSLMLSREGQPVAMLRSLATDRDPLEMESPEEFYKMIEKHRRRRESELLSWEEVKAKLYLLDSKDGSVMRGEVMTDAQEDS